MTRLRVLLNAEEIAARVDALADGFASQVDDGWTVVALLQGAIPFAADLMRAIEKRGRHPIYDSLWLESYRDARQSSGKVVVRADISRSIEGRPALIVDDVFDSGRTIAYARAHLMAKGATRTLACAFVRKPQAMGEAIDAIGWDAPDDFLVGYGMDDAGRYRGLPFIAALDP
ncbi:MAG: hypoxanthine phosphoribosyltransferase [Alphaproteobacteria bacterium]|nr:MAG: hypoxanthine phosphoribosyltransferase [Alphaproteobacteria bacterium]